MRFSPGTRLGAYEILTLIGSGAMGDVYRARDPKLNRPIAIKILPETNVANPERRARFEREAQTIAAFSHPNIVTIYSVEETDGLLYLTMEYVEGKPLSDLIVKGGLPLSQILTLAIPLADAVSAAHQQGITHRDLKPANVMVTADGRVKVLDFGLAKLAEPRSSPAAGVSQLPTSVSTVEGRIVGTVAYMSPEQAEGKPVDHRSDIFSLGVMLYELATGERPFQGSTAVSVISSIIKDTPRSVTEVKPTLPPEVGRIIRRALVKDREHRYQAVKDLRNDLEELQRDVDSGGVLPSGAYHVAWTGRRRRRALIAMGAVIAGGVGLVAGLRWLWTPRAATVGVGRLRLLISTEDEVHDPALSQDGKTIAYMAGKGGRLDLYISRVAGGDHVRLTTDAILKGEPSFSPDGERLAFSRLRPDGKTREICVIPVLGGTPIPIVRNGRLPFWSPDGTRLAFVVGRPGERDVLMTSATDGTDQRSILTGDANYPFLTGLAWSPAGREIAVNRGVGGSAQEIWIVPATGGQARRLWQDPPGVFSGGPEFTPDGKGIVHSSNRGGATNLWVMPVKGGEPRRLTSGSGADVWPSVSRSGTIAFLNVRYRANLFVYELNSGQTRTLLTHHSFLWGPSFSHDGREISFTRHEMDGSQHIWTVPADGGPPRQVTSSRLPEIYPRYTPDGSAIVFQTWGVEPRRIWRVPREGGPAVPLTPARSEHDEYADVSPDGRSLAFARTENDQVRVYISPIVGGPSRRLTNSPSTTPRWSPHGDWIAFGADRSSRNGIWVIRVDGTDQHRLTQTGGWPVWWPDGEQIAYQTVDAEGNEQIATVHMDGGEPSVLTGLRFNGTNHPFDISPDGGRLVTTNTQHATYEIWLLEPPRDP